MGGKSSGACGLAPRPPDSAINFINRRRRAMDTERSPPDRRSLAMITSLPAGVHGNILAVKGQCCDQKNKTEKKEADRQTEGRMDSRMVNELRKLFKKQNSVLHRS